MLTVGLQFQPMVKRKFDLIVMTVCLGLLGYFGWHGFYGPRSFDARDALAAKAEALEARLASIRDQRQALDSKVALMRPQSIDPDMLDELAREILDYGKSSELIVKLPN